MLVPSAPDVALRSRDPRGRSVRAARLVLVGVVLVIVTSAGCGGVAQEANTIAEAPGSSASRAGAPGESTTTASTANTATVTPGSSIPTTVSTEAGSPSTANAGRRPLFDFGAPDAAMSWRNQDDTVMGGRSGSTASVSDSALAFRGNLSLENNGGFASVISEVDPSLGDRAAGGERLRIRAVGDGRTYIVQARVGARYSYIQRFATEAGVPRVYELPIADFQPVTFMLTPAVSAPPALDPADLSQLAFYLTDKQAGPFALRVERVDVAP